MNESEKAWDLVSSQASKTTQEEKDCVASGKYLSAPVLSALDLKSSALKIAVLASGNGRASTSLAALKHQVSAVDQSIKQIERGGALAAELNLEVEFIQADICDNPLESHSFDRVLVENGVLVFLEEPEKLFQEASRLLKASGVFVLHDWHPFLLCCEENDQGQTLPSGEQYGKSEARLSHLTLQHPYFPEMKFEKHPVKEYSHSMERILNGALKSGFVLEEFRELEGDESGIAIPEFPGMILLKLRRQ